MDPEQPQLPVESRERVAGLGDLLRALRTRAGFTQTQIGAALGLAPRHAHSFISRLEHGRLSNPSLALVLDFLRACKAGTQDVSGLLDRYLATPLAVPQPAPRPRGPRKAKEDPAILKMRQEAAVWISRQVVEHMLHHELNRLGAPRFHKIRQSAVLFGRRVFRTLLTTRGKPEAVRERRLGRSRATAVKRSLTPELARCLETKVRDLFLDMEKEDELDWLPDEEEARKVMLRSSRRRHRTDWQMCVEEHLVEERRKHDEYQKLAGPVFSAAEQFLASAGVTGHQIGNYRGFITNFLNIARATRPGSNERSASMENSLAVATRRWHDPALLRRLAAFVFERWDAATPTAST